MAILKKSKKFEKRVLTKTGTGGILTKFAAEMTNVNRRAPCKLNNVKTKKDTRRGRKFFSSERLLGKGTEQDFFEAKS